MSSQSIAPLMIDVQGVALDGEDRDLLAHPLVGGLILFTRNYASVEQVSALVAEARKIKPNLLIAVDTEGGRVQRFREGMTRLPPAGAIGEIYQQDKARGLALARQQAFVIAAELRALDVDLSFSPVLDLDAGVSEIIGDRAFAASVDDVTELAIAHMQGLADAGMSATGKHYPGHGQVAPDSHIELPVDDRSIEQIVAQDELPFARLIAAGLPSIMMAHIRYPKVDELPASLSSRWIQQELRGRLGFGGAVFCDDLSMGGAAVIGGYLERAEAALEAGCDMLPVCNHRPGAIELLDNLQAKNSAAASAHLNRLLGRQTTSFAALAKQEQWQSARSAMTALV